MRKIAIIMFTDIEGYTALMQEDEAIAVSWLEKYRKHFEYCIQAYEGQTIQHFGDGTLSIFDSAVLAVKGAIKLQQLLRKDPVVPLRAGMHLGEIIMNKDEIIGDAVNIASRIESLSISGSILISGRINEELKNQKGIETKWFGKFDFKNVHESIEVFAVDAPGIVVPEIIHAQAKLKVRKQLKNFPHYPQEFVGRIKEIAEVKKILFAASTRLVTILGSGGLGKTRLAVELCQDLGGEFRDGANFIALDSLNDPMDIPKAIGAILELREHSKADWKTKVISFLKPLQSLLVIDNFEHLMDGKNIIKEISDHCPEVKILITSRVNLNLAEEREFHLRPMPVPSASLMGSWDQSTQTESVLLFTQKAQQVKPNFSLDSSNFDAVARICQELEGIPLAIELAASRIKLFSPSQILTRLEDLFTFLKTSRATDQKRHQAISETIRWSYDLLSEEEKKVFRSYSIFNVGFSIEAAQALTPDLVVVDTIESLVNKSLLRIDESDHQETRFTMLRVIREFGQQQLAQNPMDWTQIQERYTDYYLDFLKNNRCHKTDGKISEWVQAISKEIGHLRSVVHIYTKLSPPKLRFFTYLHWRYYLFQGFLREGYDLTSQAINSCEKEKDELQGKLLIAAGTFAQNLGAFKDARSLFSRALSIFIQRNIYEQTCITLCNLGWVEFRLGNFDKSNSYSQDALDLAKEHRQLELQAKALNNFAWVAKFRGFSDEAIEIFKEAHQIYRILQDEHGMSFCSANQGWTLVDLGKMEEAKDMIAKATIYFSKVGDRQLLTFSRAIGSLMEKNPEEIIETKVIPTFTDIGDSWGMGLAYQILSNLHLDNNRLDLAEKYLQCSLDIRTDIDDRWGICHCHLMKAIIYLQNSNHFEAYRRLNLALVLAEQMDSPLLLTKIISLQALLDHNDKKFSESAKKLDRVTELSKSINMKERQMLIIVCRKYSEHFNLDVGTAETIKSPDIN